MDRNNFNAESCVNEVFWDLAEDNLPSDEYLELKNAAENECISIAELDVELADWDDFAIDDMNEKFQDAFREFWFFNTESNHVYAKILIYFGEDIEDPEIHIRWDVHYDDWRLEN